MITFLNGTSFDGNTLYDQSGSQIPLTEFQLKTLKILAKNFDAIVPKKDLYVRVKWRADHVTYSSDPLRQAIYRLRKLLGDSLQTIYRKGYRLTNNQKYNKSKLIREAIQTLDCLDKPNITRISLVKDWIKRNYPNCDEVSSKSIRAVFYSLLRKQPPNKEINKILRLYRQGKLSDPKAIKLLSQYSIESFIDKLPTKLKNEIIKRNMGSGI